MITDLIQIKRLGEKKQGENERFRRHLKRHNFPELRFRRVAEEVESQIDCRSCASCCKVAETDVTKRDIDRLARYLGISSREFIERYTTMSAFEQEEPILRRRESGCIFLDGNDCSIYEVRPDTCRDFPHLIRGAGSFESRMWQMVDRATYCPIVYNSLEEFKEIVKFK
ncbi:MAG TPA: YkgJ family cysteine cluster protein [Bryobacteraceae bacterium]|nr:YkgJ family cysteine cluster protein [Bryobacteraceae bacterium]